MYYSVCVPAVFKGRKPHEVLQTIRDIGMEAFEIWGWWDIDLEALCQAQKETGLKAAAMCTRFISLTDPDCREAYKQGLKETIEAAKKLGCRTIISQVGADCVGVDRRVQHQSIVDGLKECLPMLEEAEVTVVVEPLNTLVDHVGYYLTTTEEGCEIVREVNSPWVRMLYDIYHQQIMEGNLISNIEKSLPLIGHVHTAGVPGRHELLKNCEINYPAVLGRLKELGYQGGVGLEYFPLEEPEKGLKEILAMG